MKDLFKTLSGIVLSIIGKSTPPVDADGHLQLLQEDADKLNGQMKFAGGNFAETFKKSFDAEVDAKKSGDAAPGELVVNAMIDAMRKEMATEINANKSAIETGLNSQLQTLMQEKQAAEAKLVKALKEKQDAEAKVILLENKTETDVAERIILGTAAGKNAGLVKFVADRSHYHNKMAFDFLAGNSAAAIISMTNNSFGNRTMGGGAADTIDVSELNTEFGKYLSDQQKRLNIYKEMLKPTQSREYMTKVLAIEEWRDAKVRIDSVVQQFIAKWTPLGKTKVTPLKIVNRRHKINLPIVPNDITGGYLTYLYNEGLTPDTMPVTQYVIDQLLRPRIEDDIEYKMIATGEFDELDPSSVTEGDAGQSPEKSMDGFLTILKAQAALPGTAVNFFTPDGYEFSDDNSVKYFEDYATWLKKTNPTLAAVGMNIFCDPDMEDLRWKKYREMFPLTKDADMKNMKIDRSNLTIVPLENMRGSGIMFSTPKQNFIELHHINEAGGATKLFLQLRDYEVRVFGEFWLAVGFAVAEWVFAAIQPETSGE